MMRLLLVVCLCQLIGVLWAEDCTEIGCQFQYYQKYGYDGGACFEDIETFQINDKSYIAFCENLYDNNKEAVRILKLNGASGKWESFQKITLSSGENCDDIAVHSDETDDTKHFLFICGSDSNVKSYLWDSTTQEFALDLTIAPNFDTLGSCSIEKIYGNNNEYYFYFVQSAYYDTKFATEVYFYSYDDTAKDFNLNTANFIDFSYSEFGKLSFATENGVTYMFASIELQWNDAETPFTTNSSMYEVDAKDGNGLSFQKVAEVFTEGAADSEFFTLPSVNTDSIFLAIANQQSSLSSQDASVQIRYVSETELESLESIYDRAKTYFYQSIETKNAQYVTQFTINSKQYIGIGESIDDKDGTNDNLFAIYEFDSDSEYFIPFQTISVPQATEIAWANVFQLADNEWYLAIGPCYDDDATQSGVYIYSWSDTKVTTTLSPDAATMSSLNSMIVGLIVCIVGMLVI